MRIVVTGSRTWTDWVSVVKGLRIVAGDAAKVTIVHGGALGADWIAGQAAKALGFNVEVHRADWELFGKSAGMIRNRQMLESGTDFVVGFPTPGSCRGTAHCLKTAHEMQIEGTIYWQPRSEWLELNLESLKLCSQ